MKPRPPIGSPYIPWKTATTTPDRFFLAGKSLAYSGTSSGTEYIDTTYGVAGYRMANGQNDLAVGVVPLPPNWGGRYSRMSVAWLPAGTVGGSVYWAVGVVRIKDGTALASNILTITPSYDTAGGSATVPSVSTFDFNGTALPTDIGNNEYAGLKVRRVGNDATDTCEQDIYIVGLTFEVT